MCGDFSTTVFGSCTVRIKDSNHNPRGGPWKPGHKGKVVNNCFPADLSHDKKTVVEGPQ